MIGNSPACGGAGSMTRLSVAVCATARFTPALPVPCFLTAAASSLLPKLSVEEGSYVLDYMVGSRQGYILGLVCAPNTKRLLTGEYKNVCTFLINYV